jgi:hypothetical protein
MQNQRSLKLGAEVYLTLRVLDCGSPDRLNVRGERRLEVSVKDGSDVMFDDQLQKVPNAFGAPLRGEVPMYAPIYIIVTIAVLGCLYEAFFGSRVALPSESRCQGVFSDGHS